MPGQGSNPRDLRHYLGLVWRRKFLLLAIVLLIPAAVYAISKQLPKEYVSSTTLQVRATAVSSSLFTNQISVATSNAGDAARLIETTLVARLAAEELGELPNQARELLGHIDASLDATEGSDTTTDFLTITATDENPKRAAEIANAFAGAVATRRTTQAVADIDEAIELLSADALSLPPDDVTARESLAQQLQDLRGLRATQQDTTIVVEPAVPASAPVSPKPVRNTALALVFSVLLAAGLIPLLDRLDRRIRDAADLEELIGEPLLATIPESAFPGQVPSHAVREAFQTLRASLTYFNIDRSLATVLITSASHGEGKTTVATNLAVALAMDERKVVLVDGDFRRPQAAKRLGIEPGPGIEAVLFDDVPLEQALIEVPIDGKAGTGALQVLPCATPPPNPSVLLGSTRMKTLLSELAEQADMVIIDSPPVLAVSDVIPLLEEISGTVLVARLDDSTRDSVLKARQVIQTARGSVLGTVATGAKAGGLYGYGYGYGYGEPAPPLTTEANGAATNGRGRRRSAGQRRSKG